MITITKMTETCGGCPSQWDGWDEDGAYYYFRYRWGYLRVDRSPTEEDWDSPLAVAYGAEPSGKCETIFGEQVGDGFDGIMSYEALKGHLTNLLKLPETDTYRDMETTS
jgi:hypothetical protein